MNHYKLIIFDFDGTLFATREAVLFCIHSAYETLGLAVPARELSDRGIQTGLSMGSILKKLSPELSEAKSQTLLDTYERIYLEEGDSKSSAFTRADEVLTKLGAAGFILTIVSNKAVTPINTALEYFNLLQHIALVVGDTKTLRKKPDPMAYTDYIQPKFSTILPREILVIGDTAADLLFARNIGADSCWAEYGYGDAVACRALKPNYSIRHLTDVLDILL